MRHEFIEFSYNNRYFRVAQCCSRMYPVAMKRDHCGTTEKDCETHYLVDRIA